MQTELHTATPGTATGTIRLARTLVVLAGVLLAIAALGPLGLGVIEHHYERTMLNQAVGLDAFGAAVVVPVALGTARLSRRRHPAAAFLAMGPGAFATYMSVQYVVGPEYLVVDGNAEQFFLLFAGLFVAGATVLVEAWSATSEPPADAAVDRRRSAALLATAAFVVGGMYLANDFLSAMGDFPRFVAERAAVSEYDDHPSAFWIVAFLDLAVVVPVTTAVGWALWHHRPWARRAFYGVVGWYALVPGSVAAMALTMVVRDDVAADGTKAAFFTVTAAAMAAVALRSYRPLFRSDGVGGSPDR